MNFHFKIGTQVCLKKNIYYEGLKKGSVGTVIRYEDYALSDKFRNKPLDRIECMVIFRQFDPKTNKKVDIEEPFTEAESLLYLEHYKEKPDEFFKLK